MWRKWQWVPCWVRHLSSNIKMMLPLFRKYINIIIHFLHFVIQNKYLLDLSFVAEKASPVFFFLYRLLSSTHRPLSFYHLPHHPSKIIWIFLKLPSVGLVWGPFTSTCNRHIVSLSFSTDGLHGLYWLAPCTSIGVFRNAVVVKLQAFQAYVILSFPDVWSCSVLSVILMRYLILIYKFGKGK